MRCESGRKASPGWPRSEDLSPVTECRSSQGIISRTVRVVAGEDAKETSQAVKIRGKGD